MTFLRHIYRILRSVLLSAIFIVAGLYLAIYVLVALPPVQQKLRDITCRELSPLLGGNLEIGSLTILPFSEVRLRDVSLTGPGQPHPCISIALVDATIDLVPLFLEKKIEIPYAEISGLKAGVTQAEKDGPLNIQFLIEALQSKDKQKPPAKFDVRIRKAMIKGSAVSFDRLWCERKEGNGFDVSHLALSRLNLNVELPVLSNDSVVAHLRKLSGYLEPGLKIERLSFDAVFSPTHASLRDFTLQLPSTSLSLSPISLEYASPDEIPSLLKTQTQTLRLAADLLAPSDFAVFEPRLADIPSGWKMLLTAAGNADNVFLDTLYLQHNATATSLLLTDSEASSVDEPEQMKFRIGRFGLNMGAGMSRQLLPLLPDAQEKVRTLVTNAGSIALELKGTGAPGAGEYSAEGNLSCSGGRLDFSAYGILKSKQHPKRIKADFSTSGMNIGQILGRGDIGVAAFDAAADIILPQGKGGAGKPGFPEGHADVYLSQIAYKGKNFRDIEVSADADSEEAQVEIESSEPSAAFRASGTLGRTGAQYVADIMMEVESLTPSDFGALPKFKGYTFSSVLHAHGEGTGMADFTGALQMRDSRFTSPKRESVELGELQASLGLSQKGSRNIQLRSDWLDAECSLEGAENENIGKYFRRLSSAALNTLHQTLPGLLAESRSRNSNTQDRPEDVAADFSIRLKASPEIYQFFHLPLFPLGEGNVEGFFDGARGTSEITLDFPYIQQGRDKLIEGTMLSAVLNRDASTCGVTAKTHYPAKKGDLDIDLKVMARKGQMFADIGFNRGQNALLSGGMALNASFSRSSLTGKLQTKVDFIPSVISFNDSPWKIDKGSVTWDGTSARIDNLLIHRGKQFVSIGGTASPLPSDSVTVRLAGIDVDYVFSALNIEYVKFGGLATGEVTGAGLLSSNPRIATRYFSVEDLSYNSALLGDAVIRSSFDMPQKKVAIAAEISKNRYPKAEVDGGIWIGRDSLSFDIDAHSINLAFMNTFVQAFATDVSGTATGKVKLFGTFSDIDLTGKAKADSIALRLLSTNVVYHGSDSVVMKKGRIEVPGFTLYDSKGNSALLSGELSHRYFHDPEFDFRLTNANGLLCYDTNSSMNPDWWGTIYGTGSGHLSGRPGLVEVDVDMTTDKGSDFTFVLSDRESAGEFNFLTFTDRRKEIIEASVVDTIPDFLRKFRKKSVQTTSSETTVRLDFRAMVTPAAGLTLVMDPEGGDKIVCRGGGPIQMLYDSATEELKMYGRYVLDEGDYNFTLQDIILKEFRIKPGSSIAFNGDPLKAVLDIGATYRVNTNLTDLDQSFANDRELNRTNVPVDAVLNVHGDLTSPDISFDIELPTLTSDVERKVKSLISTDDLMSRQIIYLLALNRFYTPEYAAGGSTSGAGLSSVASSTLSSQLSNVLSQMSDYLSLAPSFRSDKGDFSDMEVDLALSSRLLDNRLLINGNFGYRDRATSAQSTQFIGDFDIEYLLNKSGNLRLKAYNRFNDQNYYLRQALTTQGVGLVVRRDFDNIFSFLRPIKRKLKETEDKEEDDDDKESEAVEESEAIEETKAAEATKIEK